MRCTLYYVLSCLHYHLYWSDTRCQLSEALAHFLDTMVGVVSMWLFPSHHATVVPMTHLNGVLWLIACVGWNGMPQHIASVGWNGIPWHIACVGWNGMPQHIVSVGWNGIPQHIASVGWNGIPQHIASVGWNGIPQHIACVGWNGINFLHTHPNYLVLSTKRYISSSDYLLHMQPVDSR